MRAGGWGMGKAGERSRGVARGREVIVLLS